MENSILDNISRRNEDSALYLKRKQVFQKAFLSFALFYYVSSGGKCFIDFCWQNKHYQFSLSKNCLIAVYLLFPMASFITFYARLLVSLKIHRKRCGTIILVFNNLIPTGKSIKFDILKVRLKYSAKFA